MRLSNVVIPDIWIIEEELRRERERQRRREEMPAELPISLPHIEEDPSQQDHQPHQREERVVIIDL